jgi:hypothetical protein
VNAAMAGFTTSSRMSIGVKSVLNSQRVFLPAALRSSSGAAVVYRSNDSRNKRTSISLLVFGLRKILSMKAQPQPPELGYDVPVTDFSAPMLVNDGE